mgnify:FL=1
MLTTMITHNKRAFILFGFRENFLCTIFNSISFGLHSSIAFALSSSWQFHSCIRAFHLFAFLKRISLVAGSFSRTFLWFFFRECFFRSFFNSISFFILLTAFHSFFVKAFHSFFFLSFARDKQYR